MITFEKHFIDIEGLTIRTESAEKENDDLKDKLSELEQKIQVKYLKTFGIRKLHNQIISI